ncbi:hypothetical protein ACTMTI_50860 [Nonomuraea sp. H19]|uniref:hypothetical protein n=1 Tax=Nonomuraea sp. H19 TaxID=3452206 RepID=UPI003F8AFCE0
MPGKQRRLPRRLAERCGLERLVDAHVMLGTADGRFAHATGRTAVPLAGAVPAVASWRLSALPRGLPAAEIELLLAGCDRDTAAGLRD